MRLARWWSTEASARAAYGCAAAIGLAMLLIVYGPAFVFGTSSYWDMPALDHRSYLMGYRYFLDEPWGWPIFETHTLNVPYAQSIAFNDSLPLWALASKVVATIIPPWRGGSSHAFLGIWYAIASALQAVCGVAILRALGRRSWSETIITSLFFIAIPAWTFRFLHASLYAQFLLLWAIALYVHTPANAAAPRRLRILQLVQLGVAALLNPYHTVMSLALFAASLVRSRAWKAAAAWFAGGCAVVVAALALAGYFAPQAGGALAGFKESSSNLLGPVLPRRSGWFGESLWVDPTGLQYEGMCYLGLGLLVLVALAGWRIRDVGATIRRHAALAVVIGGAALLALSNHIYLGSHRLLAYPIPKFLHWIPDQFRAPGRFSWLPMYVVIAFVLARGFKHLGVGWKRLVLPILAILQIVDVTPDWRAWRAHTTAAHPIQLEVAGWRTLLAGSSAIEVYPAHACNSDEGFEVGTRIQYLASQHAVPINGVYSSRAERDCYKDFGFLRSFQPRPRTLYTFLAPMAGLARRLSASGLPCAEFAFGSVCHADRALIESLGWQPTPPPTVLGPDDKIVFSDPAAPYLESGWSHVTGDATRWTDGESARVVFRRTGPLPAQPTLAIEASAYLCKNRTSQDVDVLVSGQPVATLHFDDKANKLEDVRSIPLAQPALLDAAVVEVELRPRDNRSPVELRCSKSQQLRRGIQVKRMWIGSGQ